jgi:hypothetical protein
MHGLPIAIGHDRAVQQRPAIRAPGIVALGLRADPLIPGQAHVNSLIEPLERSDNSELVAQLAGLLRETGHAIAICPAWFAPAARLRLEMADVLLDRPRLAIHETALPPLAGGALASLAAAVAPLMPSPGGLVAALPLLEEELLWLGWLRSVSKLERPRPRLVQHAASYLPWSRFVAYSHPEPAVQRISRSEVRPSLPLELPPGEHALVYAPWTDGEGWVENVLSRALDLVPRIVEPSPHAPSWWDTDRVVEAVVHPADMGELGARLAARLELHGCRWCGELVASSPCPFCGSAGEPRSLPGESLPGESLPGE